MALRPLYPVPQIGGEKAWPAPRIVLPLANESTGPVPTIAATTDQDVSAEFAFGLGHQYQRKMFVAAGLDWLFYADQGAQVSPTIWYTTRAGDSGTWSTPTILRVMDTWDIGSPPSISFAEFHYDAATGFLHYVIGGANTGAPLKYRRGTPLSNGTITWSAAEQTVLTDDTPIEVGLATDSNGIPYISYESFGDVTATGVPTPWVVKATTADGTWTTASGYPLQLSTEVQHWWTSTVRLDNSGKMVTFSWEDEWQGGTFDYTLYANIWNGSSWNTVGVDNPKRTDQFGNGINTTTAFVSDPNSGLAYAAWYAGSPYVATIDASGTVVVDTLPTLDFMTAIAMGRDSTSGKLNLVYCDTFSIWLIVGTPGSWDAPVKIVDLPVAGMVNDTLSITERGSRMLVAWQTNESGRDNIYVVALASSSGGGPTPVFIIGSASAGAGSTGSLVAPPKPIGSTSAVSNVVGTPKATPKFVGSSSALAASTGSVTAPPKVIGSSSAVASASGSPTGTPKISGSSSAIGALSALVMAALNITASASATAATSGTLQTSSVPFVVGSSVGAGSATGLVTATPNPIGSASSIGSASGQPRANPVLIGTSSAVAVMSGQPRATTVMSGVASAIAVASALVTAATNATASAAAAAGASGTLATNALVFVTGTASAVGTASGTILTQPQFIGSTAAVAAASGQPAAMANLIGSSASSAVLAGALKAQAQLQGLSGAQSTVSGTVQVPGSAFIDVISNLAVGSASGALSAATKIFGSTSAASISSGQPKVSSNLIGSTGAVGDAAGIVSRPANFTGSAMASAVALGQPSATINIVGLSNAAGLTSGQVRLSAALIGSTTAISSASSSVVVLPQLLGQAMAAGTTSGLVNVRVFVQAQSNAGGSASAVVSISPHLIGAAMAAGVASGILDIASRKIAIAKMIAMQMLITAMEAESEVSGELVASQTVITSLKAE